MLLALKANIVRYNVADKIAKALFNFRNVNIHAL